MKQNFADALLGAQGRSEFVIVVVADIRGFSAFSTINESPNIAMFIKRFYLQLIHKYFNDSNFVKPTGDGLLMTFSYSEENLLEVSEKVIRACLSCLNDFPSLCENDPMINFSVPQAIGFGIARGTACCLYSGEEILDYSGHLLNLASRLNDLARPSGVVIDGNYLSVVIPEPLREMFKEQDVYVRSLAEDVPMKVFYLENCVNISDSSLAPLIGEDWRILIRTFTRGRFNKLVRTWTEVLPIRVKSTDKLKVTFYVPKKGMRGIFSYFVFTDFRYTEEGTSPTLKLDIEKAQKKINTNKDMSPTGKVTLKIEYVPKTLPRT
ncbi:MAG: hypothetical protein ACJ741_10325 [Pyrinomonadaceae bacterium]